MTTLPFDEFPITILQNCMKITSELPAGIRNNMNKIYQNLNEDKFNIKSQNESFQKILFGLTMFHSVLIERKKYGSIGFSDTYNFNDSDLETSINMVKNLLEFYQDIPWTALTYMISNIVYGGRVTDQWDNRILTFTLKSFFNQSILQEGY